MSEHILRGHWDAAISHTRARSPASFDRWFSTVQLDNISPQTLGLRAKDTFVRDWVSEHYLPTILQYIRFASGLALQIHWSLGDIDTPIVPPPIEDPRANRVVRPSPARPTIQRPSLPAPVASLPATSHPSPPPAPVEDPPSPLASPTPVASPFPVTPPLAPPGTSLRPAPAISLKELNPKYTFENFIVGPSNNLAHAAAQASAGGGGRRYSPLFLCGGTGLGKTHLLQAIAHRVLSEQPTKRIIYVSAERFTNDFIAAIQHKRMEAFRAHYRSECDLLLVDDIQFLAGREQTQEEFFHTFNALHELDRPIVFSSDKYPQQLERMEERLVSRFSWGLVADVQAPELETRVAILRKKAQIEGILLDDQVALFLAQTISSNVRELEGTLIRLAAKASLTNRIIDLAFVQGELSSSSRSKLLSVDDILRVVSSQCNLQPSDLLSTDRHRTTTFARHVAMYLCKQRLPMSYPEIGRAFGKDHTTVMNAVRRVEKLRTEDAQVRAQLEIIEKKLTG
ncbi:MAG: chromosomal replication initiator protein DnaA [Myxococcales bacterium]|nr:chromosomal replication initiator protein DnaA [Polyangiaceae bacterium]MDW8248923.1 chromosomal replication initiator protein DnaA [Myxococcales bacterium]